ncbi:OmpA family protein [Maribacter sp. 2-571]|uniref:OmpA family protein n=1 Tax=Maribacter sp. 2-571 TaxID=3417569 RepID=UPI003D358F82
MKFSKIVIVFAMLLSYNATEAQFLKKLKKKVEKAAEETVLNKADKKTRKETGKAIDKTIDGDGDKENRSKKETDTSETGSNHGPAGEKSENTGTASTSETPFEVYSKFDFETGKTIVGYENFSADPIGDIPIRWNVTGAAEIVTLSNAEGKWLRTGKGSSALIPEFINDLPENFTLEYDLIFDFDVDEWSNNRKFNLVFSNLDNPNYDLNKVTTGTEGSNFLLSGGIGGGGGLYINTYGKDKRLNIKDSKGTDYLEEDNNGRGKVMHFSVWKQGKRLRIYLDEEKIFDAPRAFQQSDAIKTMRFYSRISPEDSYFFLGNIRYAIGTPDTRNRLLTEGELTTYGITFEKGAATVKPSSYAVLKKVAGTLQEHKNLSLEIIGHTDADGSAENNLKLSEKRAEAVKEALVKSFNVDASRLRATGKGENELLATGTGPNDHAKNRRVVFKKQ